MPATRSHAGSLAGYAACACAFLHAGVSFYWAAGGRLGLDTVGQGAAELAASGDLGIVIGLWFVGLVKVAVGLLALALVRPWGPRLFRRWMLLLAGWGAATVLVLYGGVQLAVQLLVVAGAISTSEDMDWRGFYGHLYLWDPWFVIWGILLGMAALTFTARSRTSSRPSRRIA